MDVCRMLLNLCHANGICYLTEISLNIPVGVGLLVDKDPECGTGVGGSAVPAVWWCSFYESDHANNRSRTSVPYSYSP